MENIKRSEAIKNLLTVADNSCGSNIFRNFFVEGKDILADGDLSCAWFVSSLLVMTRLLDGVSFTVTGLLHRLENSDSWILVDKFFGEFSAETLLPGDVIFWNPIPFKQGSHYHVGIYLGEEIAVSNRSASSQPGKHLIMYTGLSDDHKLKEVPIDRVFRLVTN